MSRVSSNGDVGKAESSRGWLYLEMVFWGRVWIMMGKWNATVSRNAHCLNRIKELATSPQNGCFIGAILPVPVIQAGELYIICLPLDT